METTAPQATETRERPRLTADRLWQWGLFARIGGLCVLLALDLPWCGSIKGTEILRADGLERFWFFPGAAVALILIPFFGHRRLRFLLEGLTSAGLVAGATIVGLRFRQLRGIGVDLTFAGSLLALIGAIWGWRRWTRWQRDNSTVSDPSPE